MQNLQRSIRVIALIALFMATFTIFAQEATEEATQVVTEEATEVPTEVPTVEPTEIPTEVPTEVPTVEPTVEPTEVPTEEPTEEPTVAGPQTEEVEGSSVNVSGSAVANPALEALVEASGSIIEYNFTATGSTAGFEQFCAGESDITTSIRPISVAEDTACRDAGVEYLELLIAYQVSVVISNIEDDFLGCLTQNSLNAVFAPSASVTNWGDVNLDAPETAPVAGATPNPEATEEVIDYPDITVVLPEDNTQLYETLDSIVSGFGFRADAQSMDEAGIIAAVEGTPGTIGVVSLEAALSPDVNVFPLSLDLSGFGCVSPSTNAVETAAYPATPLYLYVSTASQETLAYFLDFLTIDTSYDALMPAGYTPISPETVGLNGAIVSGEASARALTAEDITFAIPPGLSGIVNVSGATSSFGIASSNTSRLTQTQQSLVVNNNFAGQIAGIESFCNGDADILFVNSGADTVCDGSLVYESYDFGQQAVVLIANAEDNFSSCLTPAQINSIWSASSAGSVTQWANVSDSMPEQDIILVGLPSGSVSTDILMSTVSEGVALPARDDVAETNRDPAYRATAVGLVSGAMSYMSYNDYLSVSSDDGNIQAVAIDAGSGCVVPDETTIMDGTYPLARSTTMLVKQSSLARIEVQSFVWSIFEDANLSIIESQAFTGGFASQDVADFRSGLLSDFDEAQQALLNTPEATEEASDG